MSNQLDSDRKEQDLQNTPADQLKSTAAADRSNTLDDESRIKVLSPGMLVMRRFVRNKLAITGLVVIVVMFLFAFIGGLLSPYGQAEVFKHDEAILKDYASAQYNTELRYFVAEGEDFPTAAKAQMALTLTGGKNAFTYNGQDYALTELGEDSYAISKARNVASVMMLAGSSNFRVTDADFQLTESFQAACTEAIGSGQTEFEADGVTYSLSRSGKSYTIGLVEPFAMASKLVYDAVDVADNALVDSFAFRYAAQKAIADGESEFTLDSAAYTLETGDSSSNMIYRLEGTEKTLFAVTSNIIVNANAADIHLTLELKDAIRAAVIDKQDRFSLGDTDYQIVRVNQTFNVKTLVVSRLITRFEAPSGAHILGTDGNGMDNLTRLMFGGRVSLLVGFIVVFLETFIGVIIGGISGYFGGWADTLLMRFVDLFNCIPFYPTVMIIGAVMDKLEVKPYPRIFLLMAVLGILGWTGIARIVRGQILSLREQDFMVATEATGIRVSRRIFRHLVPNVMPLLIVQATMSLGGIIISEATLSFLGLGVKYPLSSWGYIINAANDQFVLTNYWFIWLPAGLLIVLTVLGFNFVGDGLRDAFDPKMKR
ncbi:MAG: ABC transporter permease [Clostridiaceae bacterium]|nr:ABC transporter permease [Clostridiaceae bacterium]